MSANQEVGFKRRWFPCSLSAPILFCLILKLLWHLLIGIKLSYDVLNGFLIVSQEMSALCGSSNGSSDVCQDTAEKQVSIISPLSTVSFEAYKKWNCIVGQTTSVYVLSWLFHHYKLLKRACCFSFYLAENVYKGK